MRCLALAQAWVDSGDDVHWLAAELLPPVADRLGKEGIRLIWRGQASREADDAARTAEVAGQVGADWTVIDGYSFGALHQSVVKQAGHKVLFIDDNGHAAEYTADIVLNQNVHADKSLYVGKNRGGISLLGLRYALLRREFRQRPAQAKLTPRLAKKLLVTLGGAGDATLANRVADVLRSLVPRCKLEVRFIVGSAVRSEDVDLKQIKDDVVVTPHIEDMPAALEWADLALSSSGSTTYEIMRMGVPTALVVAAKNQATLATTLDEMGMAINLGAADSLADGAAAQILENMVGDQRKRETMSAKAQAAVDGQGVLRVQRTMRSAQLRLRPSREDDMRMIWEWANDPEARAASFSSSQIPWPEHVRWFHFAVGDAKHRMFIVERPNGIPIGTVRFELDGEHAVISVSIDRSVRGAGYGRWLIHEGAQKVLRDPRIREVHAYIKPDNAASIRTFESAGFRLHSETTVREQPALLFTFTVEKAEQ